jgi:hypothetical protein
MIILVMPLGAFGDMIGKACGGGASIEWKVTAGPHDRIELRVADPHGSNRTIKENFATIDPAAALKGVRNLPSWSGPTRVTASAMSAQWPRSSTRRSVSASMTSTSHSAIRPASALVAIQGLTNIVQEKNQQLGSRLLKLSKIIEELKSQR